MGGGREEWPPRGERGEGAAAFAAYLGCGI